MRKVQNNCSIIFYFFFFKCYLCGVETIRGIVLKAVRYNDTSLIVGVFTSAYGYMPFLVKQQQGKTATRSSAFLQPLSMIEFQADIRQNGRMARPSDIHFYYKYTDVPYSPVKTTVMLFIAEFLSAVLRDERQNPSLYQYVETSLQWFDGANAPTAIANFHLVFLMHLSRFIGIYPNFESPSDYFDLLSGTYQPVPPLHHNYIKEEEASKLPLLFRMNYSTAHLFKFSAVQRRRIVEVLNTFYRIHIPSFPELKSLPVLHEVFAY